MRFLVPIIFLFTSFSLFAQGFQSMNGRNHPEIKWVEAETEHFKLIYPQHLAGIENKVAPLAEAAWQALAQNIGYQPSGKFRLYLSNEDEIANGVTYSIGESFMNIWVEVNAAADIWTGSEKWMRKVIAHELAHAFHFRRMQTPFAKWFPVFAPNNTPRMWMEGFAQYQTEIWDSERGDRDLRLAILEDNLSLANENSFYNGGLLYAAGNSQVRYFVQQYGDSTLSKLLAHRDKGAWIYDFETAFKKVTDGKTFYQFLFDWKKAMYRQYNAQAYQMENIETLKWKAQKFPSGMIQSLALSPNQKQIALLHVESPQRPIKRLMLQQNDSTRVRTFLAEGGIQAPIQWNEAGTKLLYARTHRGVNGSILNDIFEYDLSTRNERQITQNRRASFPIYWTNDQGTEAIAYLGTQNGTTNLYTLTNGVERPISSFEGDVQMTGLTRHTNRFVSSVWLENGARKLMFFEPNHQPFALPQPDSTDFRQAIFSPDGSKLAYVSLEDNVPNVFIYGDNALQIRSRLTNFSNGAELLGWKGNDSLYVKIPERLYTDKVYVIAANRVVNATPRIVEQWQTHKPETWLGNDFPPNGKLIQTRRKYNSLKNLTHVYTLPLAATGLGLQSLWIEPLGKHTVTGIGFLGLKNLNDSFLQLGYINRQFKPTLYSNLYYNPRNNRTYNGRPYRESQSGFSTQAIFPLDALEKPYTLNFLRFTTTQAFYNNRSDSLTQTLTPKDGLYSSFGLGYLRKFAYPDAQALFLPTKGYGTNLYYRFAHRSGDTSHRLDATAYYIQPVYKKLNAYAYGRLLRHKGTGLLQNQIGTSVSNPLDVNQFYMGLTNLGLVFLDDTEKVRGYETSVLGHQMLFGTLELRMPFADLQTQILGFDFSRTGLSFLADGAVIWQDNQSVKQLGLGVELKNEVRFGGLSLIHAVGFAQPYNELGIRNGLSWREQGDIYWRLKASIPF